MLLYSNQVQLVKSYFLSFKGHKKIYAKITDKELTRYKYSYSASKFESWTMTDFKVLLLLLLLTERFSSVQSMLKYMQDTPTKQLRKLLYKKEDLSTYQNVLKRDKEIIETYEKKVQIIVALYKQEKITFIGLYWFMYHNQNQITTRIMKRTWEDVSLFFEYFPVIKETIEG